MIMPRASAPSVPGLGLRWRSASLSEVGVLRGSTTRNLAPRRFASMSLRRDGELVQAGFIAHMTTPLVSSDGGVPHALRPKSSCDASDAALEHVELSVPKFGDPNADASLETASLGSFGSPT